MFEFGCEKSRTKHNHKNHLIFSHTYTHTQSERESKKGEYSGLGYSFVAFFPTKNSFCTPSHDVYPCEKKARVVWPRLAEGKQLFADAVIQHRFGCIL